MRVGALLAVMVAGVVLAGCSGSEEPREPEPQGGASFEDLDVQATDTKGILLGVVVDEAIRPIKDATVTLNMPGGGKSEKTTDTEGRFAYGDLDPGTYFLVVKHQLYTEVQASAEVVAGDKDPRVLRVQLERLFAQDPFSELIAFDGYLACSISFPVGTTCVNDYTRIVGGTVPGCQGGCLRDYNVSKTGGNIREYVSSVGPGWQTLVFEATWVPSFEGLAQGLTISVSYFTRPTASHFYAGTSMPNPLRLQVDVGVEGEGQNLEPTLINPEGQDDLFVFFNDGGGAGSVTLNQKFQSFQTNFYYGVPPEGWSFVNGDTAPF